MDKKVVIIISFLVVIILVMAGFLVKDYVSFGKSGAEIAVDDDLAEESVAEANGAETTMVAAATTAAGATTVVATTAAPTTTVASKATVAPTTTVAATTTAAGATQVTTTKSLNITTSAPQIGGIVTTTAAQWFGGIATTTQGMGLWVTTTGTLAIIGDMGTTAGKPDLLVATSPSILGSNKARANDYIDLSSWTVLNLGTAASPPCKYGIYLSTSSMLNPRGRHLWEGSIPNLQPGQSASVPSTSVKIPHDWPAGTYYLGVYVDDHLTVSELTENNNYGSVMIIIE